MHNKGTEHLTHAGEVLTTMTQRATEHASKTTKTFLDLGAKHLKALTSAKPEEVAKILASHAAEIGTETAHTLQQTSDIAMKNFSDLSEVFKCTGAMNPMNMMNPTTGKHSSGKKD